MLSRKEIMLLKDKEKAFDAIAKHDDWSNHRKAAERSSWKKKHVPETIQKCPNRGKRYKTKPEQKPCVPVPKQQSFAKQEPPKVDQEEEWDDPCQVCQQSADLYDFPCGHFICPPCFQKSCTETSGRMTCQVCKKLFIFDRELED